MDKELVSSIWSLLFNCWRCVRQNHCTRIPELCWLALSQTKPLMIGGGWIAAFKTLHVVVLAFRSGFALHPVYLLPLRRRRFDQRSCLLLSTTMTHKISTTPIHRLGGSSPQTPPCWNGNSFFIASCSTVSQLLRRL
jgi:hypothetical protein